MKPSKRRHSLFKKIQDVTDLLQAEPVLGPYIKSLTIDPYIPVNIIATIFLSLIRDADDLLFSLLDNAFKDLDEKGKSELSNVVLRFMDENGIEDKIRVKIINSRFSKGLELIPQLRMYFHALDNSKKLTRRKSNKALQTVLSWDGAGVQFAQLLLVLRDKGWIDFPSKKKNESLEAFAARIHYIVDFTTSYTYDSLKRDLKPDNSESHRLREKYSKAFAGTDNFSRIRKNTGNRVRRSQNKSQTKNSDYQ